MGSDPVAFVGLVLIGIVMLVTIKDIIRFVISLAGVTVIWLYTGSLTSAGIAFVVTALPELVLRKLQHK